MKVITAVIVDLTTFAISWIAGTLSRRLPARQQLLTLESRQEPLALGPGNGERTNELRQFVVHDQAPLYEHPTVTFDGVVARLPYGVAVMVTNLQGRWAHVAWRGCQGWVLKDSLTRERRQMLPTFDTREVYYADHPTTRHIRAFINDEFAGALVGSALTGEEYVHARLQARGYRLPWGPQRPRLAGTWQQLLRGQPSVHISIHPKTWSIMEYQSEKGGVVMFVDAVGDNEEVTISGMATEAAGRYVQATYPKERWKELRPVYISLLS